MCLFGGGGGGGQQQPPQIIYKDAPLAPLPAPTPTGMSSGVVPASEAPYGSAEEGANKLSGTSIFKINRDPMTTNDYVDQGLDSGLYY